MLYYPYVHSVVSCGIMFGGNITMSIEMLRIEK